MISYRHLIAGGKALLLSSSPVVAVLSLPCPPPPPSPPLLANHDLGQQCEAPAAINLARNNLTAFVVFNRASIAAAATVSAQGVFLTILGGLVAHLLGNNLIYGLNIQTLLLSWQRGLRVLWQHLSCMQQRSVRTSQRNHQPCTPSFSKTC